MRYSTALQLLGPGLFGSVGLLLLFASLSYCVLLLYLACTQGFIPAAYWGSPMLIVSIAVALLGFKLSSWSLTSLTTTWQRDNNALLFGPPQNEVGLTPVATAD